MTTVFSVACCQYSIGNLATPFLSSADQEAVLSRFARGRYPAGGDSAAIRRTWGGGPAWAATSRVATTRPCDPREGPVRWKGRRLPGPVGCEVFPCANFFDVWSGSSCYRDAR